MVARDRADIELWSVVAQLVTWFRENPEASFEVSSMLPDHHTSGDDDLKVGKLAA